VAQQGRRPAVILSPARYNGKVGLAVLGIGLRSSPKVAHSATRHGAAVRHRPLCGWNSSENLGFVVCSPECPKMSRGEPYLGHFLGEMGGPLRGLDCEGKAADPAGEGFGGRVGPA